MPTTNVAFIDPKAALAALTPHVKAPDLSLGPSGPHAFDDDDDLEEGVPITKSATVGARLSLDPGLPPPVTAVHYTNVLDDLWPEFDDLEERTAARLGSLLDEVADEAQRVHLLAQDLWERFPSYKIPDSERKRYDTEFLAYLRRLNDYRKVLSELDPESTATNAVYLGLVQRRRGAGPVPDAIMHMYFAQQLGILADHADDMGEGFMGRVMDGLARANKVADDAAEAVEEAAADAEEKAANVWERITRPWLWAAGIFVGSVVAIGGTALIIHAAKTPPEPPR
ncbi:hypothetical protein [Enhygromyxa salina]|uniref:Uncharacterized protein n=1 Tax=Enhygromyxa salina TaxID=215803 RepID=A0A2S9YAK8_9BACT|nr:hypothetical protein [Enhygromyxa salina]PRQ02051.1 hypothetical protein ENSA7_56240 [Enhygromyxa salina]